MDGVSLEGQDLAGEHRAQKQVCARLLLRLQRFQGSIHKELAQLFQDRTTLCGQVPGTPMMAAAKSNGACPVLCCVCCWL